MPIDSSDAFLKNDRLSFRFGEYGVAIFRVYMS